ncbi:MAG: hypothetical protein JST23_04630 [Bacteroidetes bacterium]|nr:hypothetical protein [Bacteroidota bacterium]
MQRIRQQNERCKRSGALGEKTNGAYLTIEINAISNLYTLPERQIFIEPNASAATR